MNSIFNKLKIANPIICGAMYPCSNPELIAAAANANILPIVQPLALTYVNGYKFQDGISHINKLTNNKPIGLNLLIEQSSKKYLDINKTWLQQALDLGIKFFVTALGDPEWFVKKGQQYGAIFYHDIAIPKHAEKANNAGVDGFICVNSRAGGHAGPHSKEELYNELSNFNKPLICAGGISNKETFKEALKIGYRGVQMGTRFIASKECSANENYKQAILSAKEQDIQLTLKMTGVPVAVINKANKKESGILKFILTNNLTKHYARTILSLLSFLKLKKQTKDKKSYHNLWQAGKSVQHIHQVKSVQNIVNDII